MTHRPRRPRRPRRPLVRVLPPVVVAVVLATVGLVFPLSSSASAAGYPITYTLRNSTPATLTLDYARVGIGKCIANPSVGVVCLDNGRYGDFSGNVGPRVVGPGGSVTVNYELDPFTFAVPSDFHVVYDIGDRGQVSLVETGKKALCIVQGTSAYVCTETGFRQFTLRLR